jgi:hypothetical protein
MIFSSSVVDLHQQLFPLVINLSLEIFFHCDTFPFFFVEPNVSCHIYNNLLLDPAVRRIPSLNCHKLFI